MQVPRGVQAAVVATPTLHHAKVATPLLRQGVWCLVEKPLAHSCRAAGALLSPRVMVGHSERFNPVIRAVHPLRPTHIQTRRMGVQKGRSLDVDVVADVLVHDIDLVCHWVRAPITALRAKALASGPHGVDAVSVSLRFASGTTATLTASRVAPREERVIGYRDALGSFVLDLRSLCAWGPQGALPVPTGDDALTAQWNTFVRAVQGGPVPVGAASALQNLSVVAHIQRALQARSQGALRAASGG